MVYDDHPQYAIREVSEMTGVKPVTLRAWQRRYSLIHPRRTEQGHRLFSEADVMRIKEIQGWLAKGISIGKVANLLEGEQDLDQTTALINAELEQCEQLRVALAQLNSGAVTAIISTVLKEYPLDVAEARFFTPVIQTIEHSKETLKSVQKSLFYSSLIARFSAIIEAENKASNKGKVLCVSLEPFDNVYAWLWATRVAEHGYHVTLLNGVSEPAGLINSEGLAHYQRVEFFSNKGLTQLQLKSLLLLKQSDVNVTFSGAITRLHDTELMG